MATINQLQAYIARQHTLQLRQLLRRDYGKRNYMLTNEGMVRVFEHLPHIDAMGWHVKGSIKDVMMCYRII